MTKISRSVEFHTIYNSTTAGGGKTTVMDLQLGQRPDSVSATPSPFDTWPVLHSVKDISLLSERAVGETH